MLSGSSGNILRRKVGTNGVCCHDDPNWTVWLASINGSSASLLLAFIKWSHKVCCGEHKKEHYSCFGSIASQCNKTWKTGNSIRFSSPVEKQLTELSTRCCPWAHFVTQKSQPEKDATVFTSLVVELLGTCLGRSASAILWNRRLSRSVNGWTEIRNGSFQIFKRSGFFPCHGIIATPNNDLFQYNLYNF